MNNNNANANIQTKRILFLTNSESGQANTILAMAHEASARPNVEVHVASFPILERRVARLSPKLNFHPLDGKDMVEVLRASGTSERDFPHLPTTRSYEAYGKNLACIMAAWDGEAYVRIYHSIIKVIEVLDPGVVVVDFFMNPAFDACQYLNREFVMSSPNCPLDIVRAYQPWLKGFWYYPATGTGLPFPIPWWEIPSNIMASIALIWKLATAPEVNALIKYRNAHGIPGRLPMESTPTRAIHVICPGNRETDFPLVLADNIGLYGPIVPDTAPIGVSDPGLNQWLDRGKTVLMCMGTHFYYSESQVKAVIDGFLNATTHDPDTQFLWKLSDMAKFEDLIEDALKDPRDKDRFKIVDWLDADPASIMKHPNVVAWVHHGGANSYFEGTLAGLPQIILAQWYDLYDMASRAEYLGIGIYGNKSVAPGIEAVEFGTAIARLVGPGRESERFRERARVVAEACRKSGGKRAAVDKLIDIMQ